MVYNYWNQPQYHKIYCNFPSLDNVKLQVVDLNSKSRPIAIMINNHKTAQPLQAGLNDAYIVYEMVTEGGITRLLALFKDKNTSQIGTVRSSRHYYLDYALENDAIYVHYGWSPKAQEDISTLKINNINGLKDAPFWRDTTLDVPTEHTVYTSMEKLNNTIKLINFLLTFCQKKYIIYITLFCRWE